MFDHAGFPVAHVARSRAFHVAAPAPLGFVPAMDTLEEHLF